MWRIQKEFYLSVLPPWRISLMFDNCLTGAKIWQSKVRSGFTSCFLHESLMLADSARCFPPTLNITTNKRTYLSRNLFSRRIQPQSYEQGSPLNYGMPICWFLDASLFQFWVTKHLCRSSILYVLIWRSVITPRTTRFRYISVKLYGAASMHSVLSINSEENADFRQAQTTKHCYWLFSVSVLKNSSVSASDTKTGGGAVHPKLFCYNFWSG